jgi:uncharacterized protein (UPF0332 family)
VIEQRAFLTKAQESLAGAESEFANGRYNNCANRCYYACFQAAVTALERAGVRPSGEQWSHKSGPAQFDGLLIYRRKIYSTELRGTLTQTYALRQTADYDEEPATRSEAQRVLRRTHTFVQAIQEQADTRR